MDSPFFTLQEIAFLLLTAEKIIPYQQQYQYNNNPNHVTWNNKHKKHAKSHHEKGIPHQAFHVFSPIKKTYTIIVYALLFHLARCTFFCYYSILLLFYTVLILHPYLLHQIKFHSSQTLLLSWILHLTLQLLPHPSFPWMQTYLRNLVPYQEFWSLHPDS